MVESPAMSQDRRASIPRPSRELEKKEEIKGNSAIAEEAGRLRREIGDLIALVDRC